MKPYIKGHIVRVLREYQQEIDLKPVWAYKMPVFELFLKKYLKFYSENLAFTDNSSIINNSFKLLRFKDFLDYRFKCENWSERLENLEKIDEISPEILSNLDIPL